MSQVFRLLSSAASDNATNIHNSMHQLTNIVGYNARASAVYLKLYDKGDQTAPASTDTPFMTIYLPASTGFALDFVDGVKFDKGLGIRLTTGSADSDTGAVASGDILGLNIVIRP